jgi:selenocysteine lyase/cysteine desulfurase
MEGMVTSDLIPCQRHLFDLPEDVAYLNCAYMSPLLTASVEAGQGGVARKARPWTVRPEDFFGESERARALFAGLVGAGADDIAIVPSASYGLAAAAANLPCPEGSRILVLAEQFPSNVYTWRELAQRGGAELLTVPRPADGDWTRAVLDALDERVSIAALPHCHWTDGGLIDLARVGARCREAGAALVVDATQSLGAWPLDLASVAPDFLVAAGYKWLLGPYSLGYLYVAPERQGGRPLEHNWIARRGSEDFARLIDYQAPYQPGARRFDVGERANFALLPASMAALEQLLAWGVERIACTLAHTTAEVVAQAASLGLSAAPAHLRAGHFLGLRFPAGLPEGLPERLAREQVHVSLRGDSLRVTPHLYNHQQDVERLFGVLRASL